MYHVFPTQCFEPGGCYKLVGWMGCVFFFFQAEDGIRDVAVTGVQTCALPISIRAADAWLSTVTEAELIAPCGFLSPDHPETPEAVKRITRVVQRRPAHRTIAPDREIWLVAGVLSGLLVRFHAR